MIILVIIPGLQSRHLNKQKDLLFAGESMCLGEACERGPCLELVMISPGMFPHVLRSVGAYTLFNTVYFVKIHFIKAGVHCTEYWLHLKCYTTQKIYKYFNFTTKFTIVKVSQKTQWKWYMLQSWDSPAGIWTGLWARQFRNGIWLLAEESHFSVLHHI
jgi:hypothetical protein